MRHVVVFLSLLLVLNIAPAQAADPALMGVYKQWQAFHASEPGGPVCYAITKRLVPKDEKQTAHKRRGQVLLQITSRPAENTVDVISYVAGHSMPHDSKIILQIDKQKFRLSANGDTAWTKNNSDDAAVAGALRRAKSISVTHMMKLGKASKTETVITDQFSTAGAAAALEAIGNCK